MPEEPTPLTAEELKNFKPIDDTGRSAKQNIYSPPGGKQNANAPIDSSMLEKLRGILLGAPGPVQYGQAPPEKSYHISRDDVVNFLRPMAFPAVVAGTTALLSPAVGVPLGLAGGISAGAAADVGLQQTLNKSEQSTVSGWSGFQPGSLSSQIANTAEMALVNEAGGRVIGKGLQAMKGELTPQIGSAADAFIKKFKPSVSQFMEHMFGASPGQKLSQWVENTFATGTKRALQEKQYQIAESAAQQDVNKLSGEGMELAGKFSGRATEFFAQPQTVVEAQKQSLTGNMYRSLKTSTALGDFVKSEARQNTVRVQGLPEDSAQINVLAQAMGGKKYVDLSNQDKQIILSEAQKMGIQLPMRDVSGPVHPQDAVAQALQVLKERNLSFPFQNETPTNNPLIDTAHDLLKAAQYHIDETGAPHFDPISFEDMWTLKHIAGNYGYGTDKYGKALGSQTLQMYRDTEFQRIEQAVSRDINKSLATWASPDAQIAWKDAKALIAQRHTLFDKTGNGVRELLQKTDDSIPELDRIINDSHKLQTALNAGNLKLTGGEYASSNLRQDLRGYKISKYFQDPYIETDPITGNNRFNYQRMYNDFNRADRQASMEKLYSRSEISDINQFFKNVAEQQRKAAPLGAEDRAVQLFNGFGINNSAIPAGGVNPKIMMIRGGILLGTSTAGSLLGYFHNPAYGAGLVGIGLGGLASGKILTNKTVVRLVAGALSGQPVGDKLLAREIFGALQGTGAQITLSMQDGSSVRGTLESDGFKPLSDFPLEK